MINFIYPISNKQVKFVLRGGGGVIRNTSFCRELYASVSVKGAQKERRLISNYKFDFCYPSMKKPKNPEQNLPKSVLTTRSRENTRNLFVFPLLERHVIPQTAL